VKDKAFIQEFIRKEHIRGKNVSDLEVTDNLIESGVIDSLGIQLLVAYLEKNFSVSIADADLVPENFETVNAIWSFVNKGGN
jgi:acyl carrier protein